MVLIHQHTICIGRQRFLQIRYLSRIKGDLILTSSPDLINHRCIARTGCWTGIISRKHQIGIRHIKGKLSLIQLSCKPRNRSYGDLPVQERFSCSVNRICGNYNTVSLMGFLISGCINRFLINTYHTAF